MKRASLGIAYGKELLELAKENENIVALDADLSASTMSCILEAEYPERFFEMGIAEQNMVSTAAGLSLAGKIPFVNSFAVFITGRAYDQVRQGIALPNLNVKLVGSSCGLSDFGDGGTHQTIEDISMMRSLPNMTVISPVDAVETRKAVREMVKLKGPVYLRISRAELPVITSEEENFTIGKVRKMADGEDVTIFATGIMVSKALRARNELEKSGISARVINVSTIKPLDVEKILEYSADVRGVVTAEEHSIIGGLGSAICEALSDKAIKILRVGINDQFGQSAANYDELLECYGLTVSEIVKKSREVL